MTDIPDEMLRAYEAGDLSDEESDKVEAFLDKRRRQAPPGSETFAGGDDIHGFQIVRPVGEGSFAVVYEAWDPRAERKVAIKVLKDEFDFENVVQEARTLAKFRTHSTIDLLDVREAPNCIIQQFAEGGSLADWLEDNEDCGVIEAIDLCIQVAEAVAILHKANVIHRDLKPSNILLTAKGDVLLSDFGISIDLQTPQELDDEQCGSTPYMSPERLDGLEDTNQPQTDIYPLGVILYELLVGNRPFTANTTERLKQSIRKIKPIDPAALNNDIPAPLAKLCLQLLDKDKTKRPKNAATVARKLRWIRFRLRNKKKLIATAVTTPIVLLLLFWLVRAPTPSPELLELRWKADDAVKTYSDRVGPDESQEFKKQLSVATKLLDAGDLDPAEDAFEALLASVQRASLDKDIEETTAKLGAFFELAGGLNKTLEEYPQLSEGAGILKATVPEPHRDRTAHHAQLVSYLSDVEATFNARAKRAAFILGFCASYCQPKDAFREYPHELKDANGKPYKYRTNTMEYDRVLRIVKKNGLEQMQKLGVSPGCIAKLREALRPDYVPAIKIKELMFDAVMEEVREDWPLSVSETLSLGWNMTMGCCMEMYSNRESSLLYIEESDQLEKAEIPDALRAKLQEFVDRSNDSNAMEIKPVSKEFVGFVTDLTDADFRSETP